jgi:hypothetical protein
MEDKMEMFRCVVEDNRDPDRLGRVKIRVFGVHSPKTKFVKTEDLPWTEVLHPLDSGNSFGTSTNVYNGTYGYCLALNDTYTEFLFIGTMKGKFTEPPAETDDDGDEIGFRDMTTHEDKDLHLPKRLDVGDSPLTYGEEHDGVEDKPREISQGTIDDANVVSTSSNTKYKEKDNTTKNASYPYNKVYEDTIGNSVQIDGTPGNPRIKVRHSTGARIEINSAGEIVFHSKTGNVWVDAPGMISLKASGGCLIEGDTKINGSLSVEGKVSAKDNITSRGDVADSTGSLENLRGIYNGHKHTETGTITEVTDTTDDGNEVPDFQWSGSPK